MLQFQRKKNQKSQLLILTDYPEFHSKVEKKRLDNVAKTLKSTPTKTIVLVAYSDAQSKDESAAIERLKKSENYLIKKYRIPIVKIVTQYGGIGQGKMEMMVFIVEDKELNQQ